jgi:hypothetical protein
MLEELGASAASFGEVFPTCTRAGAYPEASSQRFELAGKDRVEERRRVHWTNGSKSLAAKLLRAANRRSGSLKIQEYSSLALPSFASLATLFGEALARGSPQIAGQISLRNT